MTELTFLIDLLLNHKLPKATKDVVAARLKEVEERLSQGYQVPLHTQQVRANALAVAPHLANQAPSTIAALARHPDLAAALEPTAPAVIAQTPAAQAAIAARQETINMAISGKAEKGRTSPRKF